MQAMIEIRDITKIYTARERHGLWRTTRREVAALSGISFDIAPGELFGLLGPNGAGKTTLIKCLTTLLYPSGGTASVNGYDITRQSAQVRSSIGCMLMGERGLYWKLTGRENLHYFAALYFVPSHARVARVNGLVERLKLHAFIDRPVESYSSGQKMKLAFAKALVNDAPILVLDEPTNTLDLPSAQELRALVQELHSGGRTIIYTTHIMAEAEALCERIAIVDHGRLIALGGIDELKASVAQPGTIHLQGSFPAQTLPLLHALPLLSEVVLVDLGQHQELTIVTEQPGRALPSIMQTLQTAGATIDDITLNRVTLEEVFMRLTGRWMPPPQTRLAHSYAAEETSVC